MDLFHIWRQCPGKKSGKKMWVCPNHFETDCFLALGQCNAGLAQRMVWFGLGGA